MAYGYGNSTAMMFNFTTGYATTTTNGSYTVYGPTMGSAYTYNIDTGAFDPSIAVMGILTPGEISLDAVEKKKPEKPKRYLPQGFTFKPEVLKCSECGRKYARGKTQCPECHAALPTPED